MIETHIYSHEIKLPENDKNQNDKHPGFAKQFNACSDLFREALRGDIPKEEAERYWEYFMQERWRLETGSY